jgi:predicted RNase H-like nuclease (RuvC/YqgF family)
MTRSEFNNLAKEINTELSTAKNSTKFNKCISKLETALEGHNAQIQEFIKEGRYINRLNGMHDTGDMIEDLIGSVEFSLNTKDWKWNDWSQYSLVLQNID